MGDRRHQLLAGSTRYDLLKNQLAYISNKESRLGEHLKLCVPVGKVACEAIQHGFVGSAYLRLSTNVANLGGCQRLK
jgi:hypothetical protein